MKSFVQEGNVLDHTPTAAVASGAVVVIGARVGVAVANIAAGESGALRVKGVFEVAKLPADAPAQGALMYWDATNGRATVSASGNTLAGYAARAEGAGASTVWLHINA